jgi:CheY-like chemotaxis protein
MPAKVAHTAEPISSKPCLLVVDENFGSSRAVSKVLAGRYRVITARTGAEALRKLRSARPDLILLELMLSDID